MNNESLSSGADTHRALVANIKKALQSQISDSNSVLARAFLDKKFASTLQIQLALQDAFRDIWKRGGEVALEFWLLWDPDMLTSARYSIESDLGDLAKQVFILIEPAIVSDDNGELEVVFHGGAIDDILKRLEREQKGLHDASYLRPGEANKTEEIALASMLSLIKQAPARLRSEIRKAGFPAKVKYDQFSEWKVFKALEATVLTAAFWFMTYGWHGLAYNKLDTLARNARAAWEKWGLSESILTNPITMNGVTWGAGLLAATLIGTGLVYGARKKREYLIKDSEASSKKREKVQVGNWTQRNGVFTAAIAVAISGALAEGAGILAHEVQGIYTAQKAYEVSKEISKVLDISNPDSPAGKSYIAYQNAPAEIAKQANAWYAAELKRPGASGVGPASEAKRYLSDGNTVLWSAGLNKDPLLKEIVSITESALLKISPNSHSLNNTFKLKAELVKWAYESSTQSLRDMAYGEVTYSADGKPMTWLYSHVYDMRGSAKTPDFLAAKDAFESALTDYETNQKAINEKWRQITKVYQWYINTISAASDAKYQSSTAFSAKFEFTPTDLTELKKKVAEVPKLEWRSPLEYWDELNNLVGKEWGISEAGRTGIVALIVLRSGVIELLAALLLFLALGRVKGYYNRPGNLLSEKHKKLVYGYYESLIVGIQNAFSSNNWEAIFPGHPGITRDEAEYLARKLIISKDPTLMEWLPLKKEWTADNMQHVQKIGQNTLGVFKNIVSGNTQTRDEAYLAKINKVLEKLSDEAMKDKTWLGIPLASLIDIIKDILPNMDQIDGKGKVSDKFDAAISHIAASLDTLSSLSAQTIEHHAIVNGTDLLSDLQSLREWIEGDMSIWKNQIANILRGENVPKLTVMVYADLIRKMDALKDDIKTNIHPNFQDISKWNRKKQEIITIYGQILKDEMKKKDFGARPSPRKEGPSKEKPEKTSDPQSAMLSPEFVKLTALRNDIMVNAGRIYKDMELFMATAPGKAKDTGKVCSATFHGIYFDEKKYSVIAYQDIQGSKAGFSIIIPNMGSQEISSPKDFMDFMVSMTEQKYQQMRMNLIPKSSESKELKSTTDMTEAKGRSTEVQKTMERGALSKLNNAIERDIDRVSVELENFISTAPTYIKKSGIWDSFASAGTFFDEKIFAVRGKQGESDAEPEFTLFMDGDEGISFSDSEIFVVHMTRLRDVEFQRRMAEIEKA